MTKGILCSQGLRLELMEVGSRANIAISWDDEPDHQILSDVAPASLFAVLNGMQYSISADPWTCVLRLRGQEIGVAITVDEFEVLSCEFSRDDYEDTLLTTFRILRQAYRA